MEPLQTVSLACVGLVFIVTLTPAAQAVVVPMKIVSPAAGTPQLQVRVLQVPPPLVMAQLAAHAPEAWISNNATPMKIFLSIEKDFSPAHPCVTRGVQSESAISRNSSRETGRPSAGLPYFTMVSVTWRSA